MKTLFFSLIGSFLFGAEVLAAAQPSDQMAQRIIELRESVELLNSEYETKKDSMFNELKSLASQKAELESRIREEELREKQINTKVAELKKNIGEVTALGSTIQPLLLASIDQHKFYVESSLPVRQSERKGAIESLESKIKTSEISPVKAALQLWSLQEDERRLANEISVSKQALQIGEQSYLAEVAKIGMVFLYFQLDDGRVGQAQRGENGWTYSFFTSQEDLKAVSDLIGSIKKQIRTGGFELPMAQASTKGM